MEGVGGSDFPHVKSDRKLLAGFSPVWSSVSQPYLSVGSSKSDDFYQRASTFIDYFDQGVFSVCKQSECNSHCDCVRHLPVQQM